MVLECQLDYHILRKYTLSVRFQANKLIEFHFNVSIRTLLRDTIHISFSKNIMIFLFGYRFHNNDIFVFSVVCLSHNTWARPLCRPGV